MTVRPLADVLVGAAHVLGVPGLHERGQWLADAMGDPPRHLVVLLVDGLGAVQLADPGNAALAPGLSALPDLGPVAAPFPSSTAVSLASLGTGLAPGVHGIVGTTFRLDDGTVLSPLTWGADPNPIATQPEPTMLERAAAAGVLVVSAAPAAHRTSGLTRAAMRGGEYPGADTMGERVIVVADAIARARAHDQPALIYVYWPDLDKAGHVHGADSQAYREQLVRVDEIVTALAELAGPRTALLVTADHGIIEVPDERRFDLESRPALRRGVVTILGEPRVRHVYTEPGRADEVRRTWAEELGARATVRSRADLADLYGPVEEWYADRIGDVVAIARDNWGLMSDRVDRLVSSLRGQHGGLTDAEVLVPLRLAR